MALDERADLARRMVKRLEAASGRDFQIERYRRDIVAAEERAEVLRDLVRDLVQGVSTSHDEGNTVDTA